MFTPGHFLDLGSRNAVGLALMRHTRAGTIRQLSRGLYDYPRRHPVLGFLNPSPDDIVKALTDLYKPKPLIQPTGAYAANLLGLSEQVPMKIVYLTTGRSHTIKMMQQSIALKNTPLEKMTAAGKMSGLVIQALRHLGQRHVDETIISKLRQQVSAEDKRQLIKYIRNVPAWIANVMRQIAIAEKD